MGYNSHDKTGLQYNAVGCGFVTVGNDGVFKLGDIKPVEGCWSSGSDVLQVLRPSNASISDTFVYYGAWEDAEEDEIGWWDFDFNDMYNDAEFPVGNGFLCNFSANDVAFQQSGAVLTGGTTLDFTADPEKGISAKQYVMLGNILPKTIKMGDIVPVDGCWSSGSDVLQVLRSTNASISDTFVYYGAWEDAEEDEIGWWDFDFNDMYNDRDVNPGDAWLCNFSALDVKLTFPGALD